jgi:hypothetical protein
MSKFTASAFVILACFAQVSASNAQTVGDIIEFCHSSDELARGLCRYYVMGVVDGVKTSQAFYGSKKMFCVPDRISEDDIIPRFVAIADVDLRTFPQDKDESASALILVMIKKSFPCP